MKQPIIFHLNFGGLTLFLWRPWKLAYWRWPRIERLCTAGQGYSFSQWRYRIGSIDGKYRT